MEKKIYDRVIIKIILAGIFIVSVFSASAQTAKWQVPKDATEMKNPIAGNSASIKNGKVLYQSYCAACHGKNGRGDGPAAASLNPKPADHTSAAVQAESDGTLFYKLSEGLKGTAMPPFKAVLHDDQRWAIVNYIKTLSR